MQQTSTNPQFSSVQSGYNTQLADSLHFQQEGNSISGKIPKDYRSLVP